MEGSIILTNCLKHNDLHGTSAERLRLTFQSGRTGSYPKLCSLRANVQRQADMGQFEWQIERSEAFTPQCDVPSHRLGGSNRKGGDEGRPGTATTTVPGRAAKNHANRTERFTVMDRNGMAIGEPLTYPHRLRRLRLRGRSEPSLSNNEKLNSGLLHFLGRRNAIVVLVTT